MNESLIHKLIFGLPIDDTDICKELYEICDIVHSGCTNECPVYAVHNMVPSKNGKGCDCFKCGKAMLDYIRRNKA